MASIHNFLLFLSFFLIFTFFSTNTTASEWAQHASPHAVKTWADQLGNSLRELGRRVTREADIKRMYKQLGALVVRRDASELLSEIRADIESMVQDKMKAVQCIMETAEEVSYVKSTYADELENTDFNDGIFTYPNAKFSPIGREEDYPQPSPTPPSNFSTNVIDDYRKPVPPVWYRPLQLTKDIHFHNIPINDTYSTVHIPTNVYDRAPKVIEAIAWSEQIDQVFKSNYKADPSLTWQYFGSARGFMRQYPGLHWESEGVDLYDCRTQPWYISAVTCSKDLVLLIDITGSMTGMRFSIARLIAHSLLDTLTSNDFVAILKFSDQVSSPVSCFEDKLVQATKENIQVFKDALKNTTTEGYGNFTAAFIKAFELLERYRTDEMCLESRSSCNKEGRNQAIMLITDGVPGNLTEVFETYNRNNDSGEESIPVRVFTYLLGKEVTNVMETQWMACLNRGYFTHMQTLEEVREEAFQYLNVIARPLVLQGDTHPIAWTSAYADFQDTKVSAWLRQNMKHMERKNNNLGYNQAEEDRRFIKGHNNNDESSMDSNLQEYELITSVSIPIFDRFANIRNNESRSAELLGVAGLDVPIKLFRQLTQPHKIGVNGYAFIVTNNGYILMHPELRPVVEGHPRENFNSVDLTEILHLDDDVEKPREQNQEILNLRESMVEHKIGSSKNALKMKFTFDDMKRVGVEEHEYTYAPIDGTPFTLGLALSSSYGQFTTGLSEKFRKMEKAGITSTNYFHGGNWKIHPEWVYCQHKHDSIHQFNSPEQKLLHFLKRRDQELNWKWKSDLSDRKDDDDDVCNRSPLPEDTYYCDQELIEKLLLEAKAINAWYGSDNWDLRDKKERDAVEDLNITMRFVATSSGLTRWQTLKNNALVKFGDWNNRAIDEDWYRAAVLLHEENKGEAFHFTVPFDAGENEDISATAYSAVYNQDGGFEVPVAVVGFHLPLSQLQQRLYSISKQTINNLNKQCNGAECGCEIDGILCFLLDSHGYVIVSEEQNDTGRFFGDVAPDAMITLHKLGVYRKITMFDYQSLCVFIRQINSSASQLFLAPLRWIQWTLSWIFTQILHMATLDTFIKPIFASSPFYDEYDTYDAKETIVTDTNNEDQPVKIAPVFKREADPCDKERKLALLTLGAKDEYRIHRQQKVESYANDSSEDYYLSYRSLIAQRVAHTNLLLVVIDGLESTILNPYEEWWSATATNIDYGNITHPCHKLPLNDLPRRRLAGCLTQHPLESEIKHCGGAFSNLKPTILLITVLLILPAILLST